MSKRTAYRIAYLAIFAVFAAALLIVPRITPLSNDQTRVGLAIAAGVLAGVIFKSEQWSEAEILLILAVGLGVVALPVLFGQPLTTERFTLAGVVLVVAGLVAWSKKTIAKFLRRR